MNRHFGIIGGDRRQAELARLLREEGHQVETYGLTPWGQTDTPLDQTAQAELILLPLPLCRKDGCLNCTGRAMTPAEVFDLFRPGQRIFAGLVQPEQWREAARRGLCLSDYMKREELAVANAIPTAEGALQIALEELPVTLFDTEVLVLGYGRIGKLLAKDLVGLGARVSVAARKRADRVWAESAGCTSLEYRELGKRLNRFRAVFNTVPAEVLGEGELQALRPDCLCVDLASQPGWNGETASALSLHSVRAGGLPGKAAPETAAAAIRNTILWSLEEEEERV